jgi:hypothetical protein
MTVERWAESKKEVAQMKSSLLKLVLIIIVLGLTHGFGEAWAAEWKEFAEASTGVFHYDAASISSTPKGFTRVWIYNMTKQETNLVEFKCKEKSYHVVDVVQYDQAKVIKSRQTYYDNPTPTWYDISPKSVSESLYKIVCR